MNSSPHGLLYIFFSYQKNTFLEITLDIRAYIIVYQSGETYEKLDFKYRIIAKNEKNSCN